MKNAPDIDPLVLALRRLPSEHAPARLLPGLLTAACHRPWWKQPISQWPDAARGGFIVAGTVTAVAACAIAAGSDGLLPGPGVREWGPRLRKLQEGILPSLPATAGLAASLYLAFVGGVSALVHLVRRSEAAIE